MKPEDLGPALLYPANGRTPAFQVRSAELDGLRLVGETNIHLFTWALSPEAFAVVVQSGLAGQFIVPTSWN